MKAGREHDALVALVAEKVMGWRPISGAPSWSEQWRDSMGYPQRDRPFSTDIAAAWQVVEKMVGEGWWFDLAYAGSRPTAVFRRTYTDLEGKFSAKEDTAPLAICLAALKAKGFEVQSPQ